MSEVRAADSFRLMGFGHRVYKNYDPRARIMQRVCYSVLSHLKIKYAAAYFPLSLHWDFLATHHDFSLERSLARILDVLSHVASHLCCHTLEFLTVRHAS